MTDNTEYICFFNSHKAWGGGEKWHSEAARFFKDHGYKVLVCGNAEGELLNRIDSDITKEQVYLSNLSFLNPFAYIRIFQLFQKYHIATIILCLPIDLKVAGVVARICHIPHIIYRRGSAIPIKNSLSNRIIFKRIITNVIANSEATKATVIQNNKNLIDTNKISVLYNGIDIPALRTKHEHARFTWGTAGRLEPQKNIETLLEVAEKLRMRGLDFELKIAGDGSLKSRIEQSIHEKHLDENVSLVGFQKNLNDFYESLDVFALSSLWEGFGYVLAEAMTYSLPIVAYNVSSNPELIQDGINGYLIPLNNTDMFADKLEVLISDKELQQQLGANGRSIVSEKFDKKKNLEKTLNYIRNL